MVIDGRAIAQQIKYKLKEEIAQLSFKPVFCDILVGEDAVSASYVSMKAKAVESVGMVFLRADFEADISQEALEAEINGINETPNLCGLIIQLPLPSGLDKQSAADTIDPQVDVDCLTQANMRLFYSGQLKFVPPTPGAVLEVLDSLRLDLSGKHIVVVGQGELVGRPVTHLLQKRGLKVTPADKNTKDIIELVRTADVIISGTGRPKLITDKWVKPGAVVIDAGTAESDGSIVGDVDFAAVAPVASWVSPVPGGVGPVTVAKLLENVVKVAKLKSTR